MYVLSKNHIVLRMEERMSYTTVYVILTSSIFFSYLFGHLNIQLNSYKLLRHAFSRVLHFHNKMSDFRGEKWDHATLQLIVVTQGFKVKYNTQCEQFV